MGSLRKATPVAKRHLHLLGDAWSSGQCAPLACLDTEDLDSEEEDYDGSEKGMQGTTIVTSHVPVPSTLKSIIKSTPVKDNSIRDGYCGSKQDLEQDCNNNNANKLDLHSQDDEQSMTQFHFNSKQGERETFPIATSEIQPCGKEIESGNSNAQTDNRLNHSDSLNNQTISDTKASSSKQDIKAEDRTKSLSSDDNNSSGEQSPTSSEIQYTIRYHHDHADRKCSGHHVTFQSRVTVQVHDYDAHLSTQWVELVDTPARRRFFSPRWR